MSEDAAKAVATAFLDRVRDRDAAGVNALLASGTDAAAADVIRTLRDGEYARFPQRLSLGGNGSFEMEPTVFNADGTRQPTSPGGPRLIAATLESQTPIEADVGRVLVKLRVVGDAWRVTSARIVYYDPRPTEPRDAAVTTMPVDLATARAAVEAWSRVDAANRDLPQPDAMTDADVPRFRAALDAAAAAATNLTGMLAKTPLAIEADDVAAIARTIDGMRREIDRAPTKTTVVAVERDDARLASIRGAFGRIEATVATLKAGLDAAEDAKPTTPRPPSFGPDVTLRLAWMNDRAVRLRGPATVPAWLVETRAFKQWERQRGIQTLRTRDDAGNAYEVDVGGARTDANGATVPMIQSVRQYRPDGTLAAVAEYGWGDFASSWGAFDETGRRYTYRVSSRRTNPASPSHVDHVRFFGVDGTIRKWQTNVRSRDQVWIEEVLSPVGDLLRTTHLVLRNGQETMTPADDLPIDGLPLVGE